MDTIMAWLTNTTTQEVMFVLMISGAAVVFALAPQKLNKVQMKIPMVCLFEDEEVQAFMPSWLRPSGPSPVVDAPAQVVASSA